MPPMQKDDFSYSSNNLSVDLKKAAMRAHAAVVSIRACLVGIMIRNASGFVVESIAVNDKFISTVLTSASILKSEAHINALASDIEVCVILSNKIECEGVISAFDFHYNIGILKIETAAPITAASLRPVNDSISVDPYLDDRLPEFDPQSGKFNLIPGTTVVSIGRNHVERNHLMVAAGEIIAGETKLDCKELLMADFVIPKHGTGGPLINCHGEVIGMNFNYGSYTPFLPINIVSMCWHQLEKNSCCLRPRLGLGLCNLSMAELTYIEFVLQKFPNTFRGVGVYKVTSDAPVYSPEILELDLIVGCDGKPVGGVLELLEVIWDKVGQPVRFDVLRPSEGSHLTVTVVVGNVGPRQIYRWPVPERRRLLLRAVTAGA